MTRLPSRTLVVVAALSLLVAVACGEGTPTEAEDRSAAARMVLTFADLPGFVPKPAGGEDPAGPINDCAVHPLLANTNVSRSAGTDLIKDAGNTRVQSGVKFSEEEVGAKEAFAELETAFSGQCIEDALKASLEAADPGLVVEDVSSERLPALAVADESAAFRLTAPLEGDGVRLTVYIDLTILRDGRALGAVFIFQAGSPFPDGERIRLTNLVADRMSGKSENAQP